MPTAQLQQVTERTGGLASRPKIDRAAGIIPEVKVCGNNSKNGRQYAAHVLEEAVSLYEGASVYLDHGLMPGDERPLDCLFGALRNVRMIGSEMYADLHYVKSHPAAAAILERVERFPRNFGLSHDAAIEATSDSGIQRVTKIVEVFSVDLVTRPATNGGIFESVEPEYSNPPRERSSDPHWRPENSCIRNEHSDKSYRKFLSSCFSLPMGTVPWHTVHESQDDPMTLTITDDIETAERRAGASLIDDLEELLISIYRSPELDRKAKLKKIDELLQQQEDLLSKFDDIDQLSQGQETIAAQLIRPATESYKAAQTKGEFLSRCFD